MVIWKVNYRFSFALFCTVSFGVARRYKHYYIADYDKAVFGYVARHCWLNDTDIMHWTSRGLAKQLKLYDTGAQYSSCPDLVYHPLAHR